MYIKYPRYINTLLGIIDEYIFCIKSSRLSELEKESLSFKSSTVNKFVMLLSLDDLAFFFSRIPITW